MKNILSLQNKISPDDFAPLDENYFKEESLETEEIGYWKASWIRLRSNKIAMVALVLIVIMFIFAFVGPMLSPYSYDQQVRGDEALWPCFRHPFGTDRLGRDILVRCMIGTRISMIVGLVSAVIVMIVGSIYGAISGLVGGKVDIFMMRIVDIMSSIPWMVLVTVISLFLKRGLKSIIIVIGFFTWMEIARLVRAETLSLKEREYVMYAKFVGIPGYVIILKHIIPSVLPTIIIAASTGIANAIMTESSLSFLGLGIQQPMSSWGSLLQNAQSYMQNAIYMAILPGLLIVLTIFAFNKLGNLLRIFVEPRVMSGEKD